MGDFSMELNEEQLQLQEWVHQFSEEVRRHESIREYKDVDRPLVLITQEQQKQDTKRIRKAIAR